jgi:hypothetical protein
LKLLLLFDKTMLHICCSRNLQENAGPLAEDYFGNAYLDSLREVYYDDNAHNIYPEDDCDFVGRYDILVNGQLNSFQETSTEEADVDSEVSSPSFANDALVLMLRNALNKNSKFSSFNEDKTKVHVHVVDENPIDTNFNSENFQYVYPTPAVVSEEEMNSIEEESNNDQGKDKKQDDDHCTYANTEFSSSSCSTMDTLCVATKPTKSSSDVDSSEEHSKENIPLLVTKDVTVTGELSTKQPNFNIDFFPVHQAAPPIQMVVFKRLAPRSTRKGKIAKQMSSNSSRKSANAPISRQLRGRRMKKSSNQPIHICLYEAVKRHESAVPVLRKKTKALLHDSVHLRLYNQSKKRQEEEKRQRQLTKDQDSQNKALLQNTLLTRPPNAVHLRLYSKSEQFQQEGKEIRMRIVDNHSGKRKKTTGNLIIRPNPTQLRLYKHTTKSQIYSLKALEEGLTDISKELLPRRTNIGPSPTQLRLYEQSKKLQQEGKQRRNNAVNKVGNTTPPQVSGSIGGPTPTQIRLYNKSKHLQEEGKRRRKRSEEKIKALNSSKAFIVSQNSRPSGAHTHRYRRSREKCVDGRQHRMQVSARIPTSLPQPPFQRKYSSRFHELRIKRDSKRSHLQGMLKVVTKQFSSK